MTVKELKEILNDLPDDLTVIIDTDEWSCDELNKSMIYVDSIKFYAGLKRGKVKYDTACIIKIY